MPWRYTSRGSDLTLPWLETLYRPSQSGMGRHVSADVTIPAPIGRCRLKPTDVRLPGLAEHNPSPRGDRLDHPPFGTGASGYVGASGIIGAAHREPLHAVVRGAHQVRAAGLPTILAVYLEVKSQRGVVLLTDMHTIWPDDEDFVPSKVDMSLLSQPPPLVGTRTGP